MANCVFRRPSRSLISSLAANSRELSRLDVEFGEESTSYTIVSLYELRGPRTFAPLVFIENNFGAETPC